jgi:Protein of unknown function (DUF3574)
MATRISTSRISAVALGVLLQAGCATAPQPRAEEICGKAQALRVLESLYFGANKPQGTVTAQEWEAFVDTVVTPRFPQGLSVLQAAGQWRNAQGVIEREASRVLQIVHEGSAREEAAVAEIMAHYKAAQQQEAVMRVRTAACVSF